MPIMGLTDQVVLRRDGKIKSGMKDPKTGYPMNLPYFSLHDAPQLIPVLGEKPEEIYFTVSSDNLQQFFRDDLRNYSKSQLVCKSMHGYVNPITNQNMGSVAAFFKVGMDVPGLTTTPFPGITRAFERKCAYKGCQDYIRGDCSEHFFLDMVIPQYSMGAIFTLDSVSINAVMNAASAFQKGAFRYQGVLSGQIFKVLKKKVDINFPDKNGNLSKRPTDVVHVENVTFAEYEAKFKDKIDPIDWEALMFWRSRDKKAGMPLLTNSGTPLLEASDPELQELAEAAPQTSLAKAAAETSDDAVLARANDPAVAPLFAEIASLMGKENSQEARFATAKVFSNTQKLADYLKGKIKDVKKMAKTSKPVQSTQKQAATPPPPPPAADPMNSNPLY